jgi:hypothetical protein
MKGFHHASAVHWRYSTKLPSFICIQVSLSGIPQILEVALNTLFVQLFWRTVFVNPMDIADDIMAHVQVCLVYWNKQSS